NLRQVGLALTMYGADNRDSLPVFDAQGVWLWDLHAKAADAITEAGAPRENLYFSRIKGSVKDLDLWWWYDKGDHNSTHRVTGYAWMIKRSSGNMDEKLLIPTENQFLSKLTSTNASAVEVAFDAILSEGLNNFNNVSSASGI